MISAFGTTPCYYNGREDGISDPSLTLDGLDLLKSKLCSNE